MFEWGKMYKHEDQIESDITERVFDYVLDFYGVDELSELTEEQIAEIDEFREQAGLMSLGFSNLISQWEDEKYG